MLTLRSHGSKFELKIFEVSKIRNSHIFKLLKRQSSEPQNAQKEQTFQIANKTPRS